MKKLIVQVLVLLIITISSLFFTNNALAQTLTAPAEALKITSPKADTVWQLGNSHTISWSPNSDNPNIEAFFETKKGDSYKTYAKILPCGKGSIIWCGEVDETPNNNVVDLYTLAKTGSYYVSIIDKATKETTRTKSPVKIVKRGEVINLNAFAIDQDGQKIKGVETDLVYVNLSERKLKLIWNSKADSCLVHIYNGNDIKEYQVKKTGMQTFDLPGSADGYSVVIGCKKDSNYQSQQFSVNIGNPSATVSYPKGGENMVGGDEMFIKWNSDLAISTIEIVSLEGNYSFGIYGIKYGNKKPIRSGEFTYIVADTTPANSYYVQITDISGRQATSKIFTINQINRPSIQVLSPNGGESFIADSDIIKIKGQLSGVQDGTRVNAYLYHPEFGNVRDSIAYTDTAGSVYFEMNLGKGGGHNPGQYKITICAEGYDNGLGKDLCDTSDNFFTLTSGSIGICTFTRDLTLGSMGDDVSNLQYFLQQRGFLGTSGEDKGYFGVATQAALAKYQASVGISPADGYFGPVTRATVSTTCISEKLNPTLELLSISTMSEVSQTTEGVIGGTYQFDFTVTANGGDVYIPNKVSRFDAASGVSYEIFDQSTGERLPYEVHMNQTSLLTSSAEKVIGDDSPIYGAYYLVREGNTEKFTASVRLNQFDKTGTYSVEVFALTYLAQPQEHSQPVEIWFNNIAKDTRSNGIFINATNVALATPATPSANVKTYLVIDLEKGMAHKDVIGLQKFLNSNGYIIETIPGEPGSVGYETNYFGEKTKQALIKFQKDKGISPAWGFYGPQTRRAMGI